MEASAPPGHFRGVVNCQFGRTLKNSDQSSRRHSSYLRRDGDVLSSRRFNGFWELTGLFIATRGVGPGAKKTEKAPSK